MLLGNDCIALLIILKVSVEELRKEVKDITGFSVLSTQNTHEIFYSDIMFATVDVKNLYN